MQNDPIDVVTNVKVRTFCGLVSPHTAGDWSVQPASAAGSTAERGGPGGGGPQRHDGGAGLSAGQTQGLVSAVKLSPGCVIHF